MSTAEVLELRNRARRARELALTVFDKQVAANLKSYAEDLEAEAAKREAEIFASVGMNPLVKESGGRPEAIAAMKSEPDAEPEGG